MSQDYIRLCQETKTSLNKQIIAMNRKLMMIREWSSACPCPIEPHAQLAPVVDPANWKADS